jgi:polyphosphate kinase
VLQEAIDPNTPLVERMRFLGIFSNNRDEFFKVRVATTKRMIGFGKKAKNFIGEDPKKLINEIQDIVIKQQIIFENAYAKVLNELEKEDIYLITERQIDDEQFHFVKAYFESEVLPVISPIMLQSAGTFPYLKDKSIYLALKLSSKSKKVPVEYALVEIPTYELSRFLVLPPKNNKKYIMILDDVIRSCLPLVFSLFEFDTFEAYTVKITRDAELDIDNDLSKSFIEKISKGVKARKQGQPVRFTYDQTLPKDLLDYMVTEMELDEDDNLIPGGRYHNFKDFIGFPNIGGKHLEYVPFTPVHHERIYHQRSILKQIKKKDILIHPPYHKFSDFVDLLREAAIDPKVRTIKITIYRVARRSKVLNALINALRNGKRVCVNIELQARFDEDANIKWSHRLEEEGAEVLFGIKGLKVHSKLVLITREEDGNIMNYAAVSTGNFHEGNAKIYSDVTLMTADKRITAEVSKVFDFFEHTYRTFTYKHLLVSPLYMRKRLIDLINNEMKNAKAGKDAYILLKINNLVDNDMVRKLYQANNAGVKIKLIVRGICSIVPGVPGKSENIEAISIVDRYLEHCRIFVFCNNNDELYYISSADWMTRNLDHRCEVTCPIYDPDIQKELKDYLEIQLKDNVKARIIDDKQDNTYKRDDSPEQIQSQAAVYEYYKNRSNAYLKSR